MELIDFSSRDAKIKGHCAGYLRTDEAMIGHLVKSLAVLALVVVRKAGS
jgi:hypothetical protein